MKQLSLLFVLVFTLLLSSCQIVGDIFKAGVGVGVFAVVAVVGVIIFIIAKAAGGGR